MYICCLLPIAIWFFTLTLSFKHIDEKGKRLLHLSFVSVLGSKQKFITSPTFTSYIHYKKCFNSVWQSTVNQWADFPDKYSQFQICKQYAELLFTPISYAKYNILGVLQQVSNSSGCLLCYHWEKIYTHLNIYTYIFRNPAVFPDKDSSYRYPSGVVHSFFVANEYDEYILSSKMTVTSSC